jgi:hypothetical protein
MASEVERSCWHRPQEVYWFYLSIYLSRYLVMVKNEDPFVAFCLSHGEE